MAIGKSLLTADLSENNKSEFDLVISQVQFVNNNFGNIMQLS